MRVFGDDLDILQAKADEVLKAMEGDRRASSSRRSSSTADVPQVEVKVDLAAAQRYGAQAGRRAARRRRRLVGRRGGRRHLPRRQGLRRAACGASPRARDSLTRHPGSCRSTRPTGGQVRLDEVADVRDRADAEHDRARGPLAAARRQRQRRGTRSRLGRRATSRTASRTSTFPLGYRAELLGEYKERQDAQRRLLLFGIGAAAMHLPAAAGVVRELAPGDAVASSPCRWRWSAACSPPTSAAASSRSARWSASSRCSGSPRATAS